MIGRAVRSLYHGRATANFDGVARLYRWAEYLALGPLLRRTREEFLPDVRQARNALVLGDGDGRFTAALLRCAPALQVTAVDISAHMLALLRTRCARGGDASRVQTLHRSALKHPAASETDLIATHFFLDCLTQDEVNQLAHKLATEVRADCRWLISEFGVPAKGWRRYAARAYIRALYLAFRVLTGLRPQHLPDYHPALRAAGWILVMQRQRMGGLLVSDLWQLHRSGMEQQSPGTT